MNGASVEDIWINCQFILVLTMTRLRLTKDPGGSSARLIITVNKPLN